MTPPSMNNSVFPGISRKDTISIVLQVAWSFLQSLYIYLQVHVRYRFFYLMNTPK